MSATASSALLFCSFCWIQRKCRVAEGAFGKALRKEEHSAEGHSAFLFLLLLTVVVVAVAIAATFVFLLFSSSLFCYFWARFCHNAILFFVAIVIVIVVVDAILIS